MKRQTSVEAGQSYLAKLRHDDWFGGKTIGFFGGVALLINNITGPGVPSLPNMFAESGWLLPTLFFLVIWAMSSLSTTMYCEAMRKIPGNEHFRDRIEYSSIVAYYFGRKAYIAAQIGLNGALQSLNIISVIQSAQVMDNAISAIFGHSCGINVSPFALSYNGTEIHESVQGWSCIDTNDLESGNAWGCHVIISLGFLVALVITIPMGYFKLDDNMIVQEVAFVLTFVCWLIWLVACFFSSNFTGGDWHIPAVTKASYDYTSQAGVLGTILFNFGFVTTVPSWVNEKKPSVSVNRVVWLATFLCNAVFFVMGIPPAMAFQQYLAGPATGKCAVHGGCAQSIMDIYTSDRAPETLREHSAAHFILHLSVYLFPIVAVLSSIPVFSIVIKYNCVENGWSHKSAFFWGVLFPWIVAIPLLYQPDALNQFITFSSLIFVSFTDFIVPWALYMKLQRREERGEVVETGDPALDISNAINSSREEHEEVAVGGDLDSVGADSTGTTEESPLLSLPARYDDAYGTTADGKINRSSPPPASSSAPAPATKFAPAHYAFPPSWGFSHNARFYSALALVVAMTGAAIAGTVLQIETTASTTWNCAAVGQS